MTKLNEVYGIRTTIPVYTYVDRAGWDRKFTYLLGTERHIVVHGVSKQGKSCLRKKNLNESDCAIVQCLPSMTATEVLISCLRSLEAKLPGSNQNENQIGGKLGTELSGEINKVIAKLVGKLTAEIQTISKTSTGTIALSGYQEDLTFISRQLREHGKRLVLEDFHYLSEDSRKDMAYYLKAFYEYGIHVIIIGIWAEQNLLTYYNPDLSGRIEEIDLLWSEEELITVLRKGYEPLNIIIHESIEKQIIAASFGNVGITQRLAERFCYEEGTFETENLRRNLYSQLSFNNAIASIIDELEQRYKKIFEVFSRGFQEDTELKLYKNIFRVACEANDYELVNGISRADLLGRLQNIEPRVRAGDMDAALSRIERLQTHREITPNFIAYHSRLKLVSLADREFLFYRKFGNPSWDWS